MATRKTSTKKTATKTTNKDVNKSDHIREWFKSNPNGTAVECSKALAENGIEVGSGHCQQILNKRKSGGKVDVAQIKLAAEFVNQHGDVDAAVEAINSVGAFIDSCGNAKKALAALEAYQAVADVLS